MERALENDLLLNLFDNMEDTDNADEVVIMCSLIGVAAKCTTNFNPVVNTTSYTQLHQLNLAVMRFVSQTLLLIFFQ